jgi:hypothetical protein
MSTDNVRALLAILALVALVAFGFMIVFVDLTGTQQTLLGVVVTAIIARGSSSFSYFYDGTAGKTNYPATTSIGIKKVP